MYKFADPAVMGRQGSPRFRTIQVCPKDLPAALRQACGKPTTATRGRREGDADVRHGAARVHHVARRRGGALGPTSEMTRLTAPAGSCISSK
jgi:hypothetical protein